MNDDTPDAPKPYTLHFVDIPSLLRPPFAAVAVIVDSEADAVVAGFPLVSPGLGGRSIDEEMKGYRCLVDLLNERSAEIDRLRAKMEDTRLEIGDVLAGELESQERLFRQVDPASGGLNYQVSFKEQIGVRVAIVERLRKDIMRRFGA